MAPADNLTFQTIILHVNATGQQQHALRQLNRRAVIACAVVLTTRQHGILVGKIAAILPQLAEHGVVYNL